MERHNNFYYTSLLNNEDNSYDIQNEYHTPIASQIPMQYSSQPLNAMGSSKSPIVEEPTQKKRAKNFSTEEDLMLVSAWLNISMDPIHGNDQKNQTYWERVHAYYHEHREFLSDRSPNALMHRWSNIQLAVGKFHGYYIQITNRQQSGVNEHDKVFMTF